MSTIKIAAGLVLLVAATGAVFFLAETTPEAARVVPQAARQGLKGCVRLPDGTPAAGIPVMLLRNNTDPIAVYLRKKMGAAERPLATTTTDRNGSFAIGVLDYRESVNLHVNSIDHPEIVHAPVQIAPDEWLDLGKLQLEPGLIVRGYVVDTATGDAIQGATVYVNHNHASGLAFPGRQLGTPMSTDSPGWFHFDKAPSNGLIKLVAEADGYGIHRLLYQQLDASKPNDFVIRLERGRPLTGVVIDARGRTIANARVSAGGLSSKTPQVEVVRSDAHGRFRFDALMPGPYQLRVAARQHQDVEVPLVQTDEDVKVVMPRLGLVKLRVVGRDGQDVRNYRLRLLRVFPNSEFLKPVSMYPELKITARDYDGQWVSIGELPADTLYFQLEDGEHAMTLSPAFEIVPGVDIVQVEVTLTTGGSITGTVIDDEGKPIAGADVSTDANIPDSHAVYREWTTPTYTQRSIRTDQLGRFRIDGLSFSAYKVRATHHDYCSGTAFDIHVVAQDQIANAGVMRLERGTIVRGAAKLPEASTDDVEIRLYAHRTVSCEHRFHAVAITDSKRRFRMPHRVPPGRYEIDAVRKQIPSPFDNLLLRLRTRQELTIEPGQDVAEVSFELPRTGR